MADGITLNPGTGGAVVDTETNAARAGAQMQRVKIALGALDQDAGDPSNSNPIPTAESGLLYKLVRRLVIEQRMTNTLLREGLFPVKAPIDDLTTLRADEDAALTAEGF